MVIKCYSLFIYLYYIVLMIKRKFWYVKIVCLGILLLTFILYKGDYGVFYFILFIVLFDEIWDGKRILKCIC